MDHSDFLAGVANPGSPFVGIITDEFINHFSMQELVMFLQTRTDFPQQRFGFFGKEQESIC